MAGIVQVPGITTFYTDARFEIITTTRDTSAATGTVAYTGANFTPKAVLVFAGKAASVANAIGFAENVGTGEMMNWYSSGGAGFYSVTSNLLTLIEAGGANYNIVSVASWDTDGISLTYTKTGSPTGTADITIAFFR